MTKTGKGAMKVDGFVVQGALPLSGKMRSTIPVEAMREPADYVKTLAVSHLGEFEEGDELSGALAFFMSKNGQSLEAALGIIGALGHRPAIASETEFLLHDRDSQAEVFKLAFQHAKRRRLDTQQVSGITKVFLPVFGTNYTIADVRLTPALILHRQVGRDGYELVTIGGVHPGWLIPIVQAT